MSMSWFLLVQGRQQWTCVSMYSLGQSHPPHRLHVREGELDDTGRQVEGAHAVGGETYD